jgi:hypothetical protein
MWNRRGGKIICSGWAKIDDGWGKIAYHKALTGQAIAQDRKGMEA